MKSPSPLDFNAYHTNFANAVAEKFTDDIEEVSAYKRYEDAFPGKIITFEFSMADPANPEDMGTEQWHADVRFSGYVIVPFTEENSLRECRRLALQLAAWIYGKRFGCTIGPAKVISCTPDSVALPGKTGRDNEAEEYECWKVEWSHEAFIGDSIWETGEDAPEVVITIGNGEETEVTE